MATGILYWSIVLLTLVVTLLIASTVLGSAKSTLRYYSCFAVYIVAVSTVALIYLPIFCFRPFNVKNTWLVAKMIKHITKLLGITWELRNGDILAENRGAVVVANHQSMLDILGMFNIWDVMEKCAPVAKKEIFYFWPLGLAAWLNGTIFINRSNPAQAIEQMNKTAIVTRAKKIKLWIFPEGTRKNKEVPMLPFKKGAFRVAISCQVPIIPVVYSPYYFIDHKKKHFGTGKIIITVLPEISTKGFTVNDVDNLMEETWNKMVETYEATTKELNDMLHLHSFTK